MFHHRPVNIAFYAALVWLAILTVIVGLSGCRVEPDPHNITATPANALRDTSQRAVDVSGDDIPVFTDRETGCQYVGYIGHGLAPRMSRYTNGKQTQLGCYITETSK